MKISIPSTLASGAHQAGEETELVIFCAARALDRAGSGRVEAETIRRACSSLFTERHSRRLFDPNLHVRYWERDRHYVKLNSEAAIVASFEGQLLLKPSALVIELSLLDSRPRRGAALLAAILAGVDDPRSNLFIRNFSRVDRKTIGRWMNDDTISTYILAREPRWASQ